ncbi:EamA family transporter [Microbacterium sp. ASV49]|uniref:EamA family transporter n=1 Tax=Microbacterium candidum TaxID=3041922 RepID=A0ABT7N499_9MICO|nr:EamA family transporter [Microbacterium sp. ASV49]MDL9981510.1 EamA family transporter [Microbacterium sp. ASV49]
MSGHERSFPAAGFLLAVGSAASFALSGTFASALMSAGWSAGAAATARISLAALVLAIPTAIVMRGRWVLAWRARGPLLLFGLLAVAGCQLAFFIAVEFIPPSLALLIEFMGPVLLVFWTWARTRIRPTGLTFLGAGIAVLGLLAISGIGSGQELNPIGILFALIAAIGNAAYYATGADGDHGIPPLPFVGLGLAVGSVTLIAVSAVHVLPFTVTATAATIAEKAVSPLMVVAGLVLISTVLSYVLGVAAARRLGAVMSAFTGYSEALFGIFWPIVLLGFVPSGLQWLGAALIVAGVVVVKLGELRRVRPAPAIAADRVSQ